MPQPSSTRQVSSTGLSRRCCLRASPDRPTRLRLAVPKWTRRQGEETPLGPSSGEETPISQDGMSYRVRSLPSSLFHPSNRALPSDCVARVEKSTHGSSFGSSQLSAAVACEVVLSHSACFQVSTSKAEETDPQLFLLLFSAAGVLAWLDWPADRATRASPSYSPNRPSAQVGQASLHSPFS